MTILFWFSVSINTILLAKKSERWKACCLSWFLVSWLWVMPGTRKQNLQSEGAKKVIILRRGPRATPRVEILTKHFFSITNSNVSFTLLAISISWEEAKQSYFHLVSFKDWANFWLFKLPCPRSFSLPSAYRLSRVGWFSHALAFRSLNSSWGKMRTTRSLPRDHFLGDIRGNKPCTSSRKDQFTVLISNFGQWGKKERHKKIVLNRNFNRRELIAKTPLSNK